MKRHLGSSSSYELDDDLENSNFSSHFRTRSLDLPLTRNNEVYNIKLNLIMNGFRCK